MGTPKPEPIDDSTTQAATSCGSAGLVDKGGWTPDIPATVGHYHIIRLIGEGGMGSVYLAEQENPHRAVALKVIKAGYVNAEFLRRFEQESWALDRKSVV